MTTSAFFDIIRYLSIINYNAKKHHNALLDSACVLQNMMIAATALGVGSCYINVLHWLDESEVIREFMYTLGLGKNETITGSLSLGYPASDSAFHIVQPEGHPITYVR